LPSGTYFEVLEVAIMEESPKYVDVSYKINCVSHIDSVTSTYYVDVKLFYHWIDPNFIGRKKNETVDIKTEGSWNPDIIVTNEHELVSVEDHREVKVNNPTTGEIKSSTQYRGTLFINVRPPHDFLHSHHSITTKMHVYHFRTWIWPRSQWTARTCRSA
jgi:hypothetical protein